jgi:ribosomal RNA assembly protein
MFLSDLVNSMIRRIRIPEERVGVLIGEGGKTRKIIELKTRTKISVSEGEVRIETEDAIAILTAENIVRAIGRGFAPEKAMKLLDEEFVLEIIELPKEENRLRRIKSRIIGEGGRARVNIEKLTGCDVVVYGKTVAIIGEAEAALAARMAAENLISGFSHNAVWQILEKWRIERKMGPEHA